MIICDVEDGKMVPRTRKSFEGNDQQKEVAFLRPLVRKSIESGGLEDVLPGLKVLAEEVGAWVEVDRRIDVLAMDRDGCIVPIEVKRTNHGGHAELQVLRYAALLEGMTFDNAVDALHVHMMKTGSEDASRDDAENDLIDFLDVDTAEDARAKFGHRVRSVIVSGGFSIELLTAVRRLQDGGENITCLQVRPFKKAADDDGVVLAVNLVKTAFSAPRIDFKQVVRKPTGKPGKRGPRETYFVKVDGNLIEESMTKRDMVMLVVKKIVQSGHTPAEIDGLVSEMTTRAYSMFEIIDGELSAREVRAHIVGETSEDKAKRFCCERDEDLFVHDGKTYALSNQWGKETDDVMNELLENCGKAKIEFGITTPKGSGQKAIGK